MGLLVFCEIGEEGMILPQDVYIVTPGGDEIVRLLDECEVGNLPRLERLAQQLDVRWVVDDRLILIDDLAQGSESPQVARHGGAHLGQLHLGVNQRGFGLESGCLGLMLTGECG